jgi:hypothetical protein
MVSIIRGCCGVGVAVFVGIAVGVATGVGVAVEVDVGALVGFGVGVAILVAAETATASELLTGAGVNSSACPLLPQAATRSSASVNTGQLKGWNLPQVFVIILTHQLPSCGSEDSVLLARF